MTHHGIHRAGRGRSAADARFDFAGRRDFACTYSFKATALLCSVSCELYTSVTVPRRAADTIGCQPPDASRARESSADGIRATSPDRG